MESTIISLIACHSNLHKYFVAEEGFEPVDLLVMSQASYRTAPLRGDVVTLYHMTDAKCNFMIASQFLSDPFTLEEVAPLSAHHHYWLSEFRVSQTRATVNQ